MSFADKTLTCRDCGAEFTFTSGEQEFYAQKGFDNEPTRCQNCRRARKQGRNSDSGGYGGGGGGGYSSRDSYGGGGGGGYSSRDSYGGGSREQRQMHTTTCSSCGRDAQVPFVPRGDKPVYCNDCFRSQRSTSRW
jgi:CxxC-x17-CxxC domain-containing protein